MVVADESSSHLRARLAEPMNAIVLHEDKEHYPSADQVYGEEVRTAVLDEDAMDLDTPLVEPVVTESDARALRALVDQVRVAPDVREYIATITRAPSPCCSAKR